MKRLIVFVPAILLVLFLLNSFVLKKDGAKRIRNKSGLVNTVFKSTDGGHTWQDISKGLPENLLEDSIRGNSFFANDKGLYLRAGKELYHNTPNATAPFWTKKSLSDEHRRVDSAKSGISADSYWAVNVKTTKGTSVWSPIFEHYHEPRIRSVFETAGGTIFIGIDRGIFRSTDNGKTWKQVHAGHLVGNLAESDGVLLATSMRKIIRSTDNGENWAPTIIEDSVAFDVKQIKGGFAAITSNSESNTPNTSRLSTSYDGGKTWQPINAGLQEKILQTWNDRPNVELQRFQTSITQVGDAFFSTHREGIFRSSDKGKTWKLLLPSVDSKGFNLFVSGSVIYAIRSKGGC